MRALLIPSALFLALPAAAQAQSASPLIGRWALDVSRMKVPPGERPRSVAITYGDAGAGRWSMDVEIVSPQGGTIRAKATMSLDGKVSPSEGYPGVDKVAATSPAPNILALALYKDGMPRTTRTYVVSPDGKTMSESVFYLNLNGEPGLSINYFDRVR